MDVTAKASANYSDADITIITDEYTLEPTRETVDVSRVGAALYASSIEAIISSV